MNRLVIFHVLRDLLRRLRRPVPTTVLDRPGVAHGNSGLCLMHGSAAAISPKTVIVLGAARGGTSMVAGALDALGVFMGEKLTPMFEDPALVDCLERADLARARCIAAERDARYTLWGFKHPRIDGLLSRWQRIFRAPVYVVVFRDAMAVGARRAITHSEALDDHIEAALDVQKTLLQFARAVRRPCLLVSYEKALLDPEFFVGQLAEFLGIDDAEACGRAAAFIEPSPVRYRQSSRVARSGEWRGRLERVDAARVSGWACRIGATEPVEVELLVNGEVAARIGTAESRRDVQERLADVVEHCGYSFRLGEQATWRSGDELAVRVAGEKDQLIGSPVIVPRQN